MENQVKTTEEVLKERKKDILDDVVSKYPISDENLKFIEGSLDEMILEKLKE